MAFANVTRRRDTRHQRNELRSHFWRRKVRPAVLQRDNYICHLCGKRIDMGIKYPHPMSASVDHVIGAGTGYDMRYLKAAHLGCNTSRGDPQRGPDPKPRGVTRW